MNLLDIILIIVLIGSVTRGARVGVWRQFFSLIGIITGVYLSLALMPIIAPHITTTTAKVVVALILFSVFVAAFGGIVEIIAQRMRDKHPHKRQTDNPTGSILGAAFGLILGVLWIWLAAAAFWYGPLESISSQIQGSRVVHEIDRIMPNTPPQIMRVQKFMSQARLPQVFIGAEPNLPTATAPTSSAEVAKILNSYGSSAVQITGFGCGGILEGSGFVASDNLVVTNAHVVAGVSRPVVHDRRGIHATTVVYFDPNLDIAILRSSNLAGDPLPLATNNFDNGTVGAILGYPGGGPLTGNSAVILQRITAIGRNIYGQGTIRRSVYVLNANVEQGDSGGPFLTADGQVAGVVFARSQNQANVGYAITSGQVAPLVNSARSAFGAVATGTCAE